MTKKIDQVYNAIARGFNSAPSIALATGIEIKAVSSYLTRLRRRGEIEITGVIRESTSESWRKDKNRPVKLSHRFGRSGRGANSYRIKEG